MNNKNIIYPDAIINLLMGLFIGNILLCIQQLNTEKYQNTDNDIWFVLSDGLIYIIFLLFGYFTIFERYHRNSFIFEVGIEQHCPKTLKKNFTYLVLVVFIYSLIPFTLSLNRYKIFYILFIIVAILDMMWMETHNKLLENSGSDYNLPKSIKLGYLFDLMAILSSSLLFIMLIEKKNQNILPKNTYWGVLLGLHLIYLVPFGSVYLSKGRNNVKFD